MICVSLSGLKYLDCIDAINLAPYCEVRIDQLTLSEIEIAALFQGQINAIATFRPSGCTDELRKHILKLALDSGAGMIDIEFEASSIYRNELISYAHNKNAQVIISFHDYQGTPSKAHLNEIIESSFKMGADLVKIVTTSHDANDNAVVLSLYEQHENLIAFCMGESGKITRIAAPLLGSKFTYASLREDLATAPGQITIDKLKDIYKAMNIIIS